MNAVLAHPGTRFPHQPASTSRREERAERAERTDEILRALIRCRDRRERTQLLDELVVVNMCVAEAVAARYRGRGVAEDDLEQVAYVALVRAARNYDTGSGHDFLSYAVPTMRGEVRRYFRDHGWMVRPPRRIQEMQAKISGCESALSTTLGRPPRPSELAAHLDAPLDDVEEALASEGCFTPTSLDRAIGDDGGATIGDVLGTTETGQGAAEARVVLAPVVRRLNERDRRILSMRFFEGCTQQEIADQIGVTQMQVSRLLSRIFTELRDALDDPGPSDEA